MMASVHVQPLGTLTPHLNPDEPVELEAPLCDVPPGWGLLGGVLAGGVPPYRPPLLCGVLELVQLVCAITHEQSRRTYRGSIGAPNERAPPRERIARA